MINLLKHFFTLIFIAGWLPVFSQVKWQNVDTAFGKLPKNFHVYKTTDSLDGKPFIAYYAEAKLKDPKLKFTTDTSFGRRLTPLQFFKKNAQPLLVVNGTFFSFATHQNLNLVIKNGRLLSYNVHTIPGRGKDTFTYRHPLGSAIGISKKRKADVAWLYTDSAESIPRAFQLPRMPVHDSSVTLNYSKLPYKKTITLPVVDYFHFGEKWRMKTAIGGGPVILQNGEIKITAEEELKFSGKTGLTDKHPRTCMGYTKDGRLIIMVIQGRFPGIAEGATLAQEARLLKDLGCIEALNLDGGGSSCLLINGKETIKPSDKEGQRAVPAVFIIK